MMSIIPYEVVLLRHAQSEKNIKRIHGGQGEALTAFGKKQAVQVSKVIRENIEQKELKVFTSSSIHTQATAIILCKELNLSLEKPLSFTPLDLGVADGLSEDELLIKYPDCYELFRRWRAQEIDIKELIIPQMESYMSFWNRGNTLLSEIKHQGSSVLVCSNSLMILLTHIMMKHHPVKTNLYKHFGIENCGIISFKTLDYKDFVLDEKLTTVVL